MSVEEENFKGKEKKKNFHERSGGGDDFSNRSDILSGMDVKHTTPEGKTYPSLSSCSSLELHPTRMYPLCQFAY